MIGSQSFPNLVHLNDETTVEWWVLTKGLNNNRQNKSLCCSLPDVLCDADVVQPVQSVAQRHIWGQENWNLDQNPRAFSLHSQGIYSVSTFFITTDNGSKIVITQASCSCLSVRCPGSCPTWAQPKLNICLQWNSMEVWTVIAVYKLSFLPLPFSIAIAMSLGFQ